MEGIYVFGIFFEGKKKQRKLWQIKIIIERKLIKKINNIFFLPCFETLRFQFWLFT